MTTLGLEEDSYIASISKTAVAIWCVYQYGASIGHAYVVYVIGTDCL